MVHIEKKEQPDLIFNSAAAFEMTEPPAVCVYAPSIASLFRLQPDNLTCQSAVRGVCGEILMHRFIYLFIFLDAMLNSQFIFLAHPTVSQSGGTAEVARVFPLF